jgi:hypothetical protein
MDLSQNALDSLSSYIHEHNLVPRKELGLSLFETSTQQEIMNLFPEEQLTPDLEIGLTVHIENIFSTIKATKQMTSFDELLAANAGKVEESQVDSARTLLKNTLHLEEGSAMDNIVNSMVTEISGTINKGVPFKEMINSLSDSFGATIRAQIDSGKLNLDDIRNNADKLMTGLDDPAKLLSSLGGNASTTVPETAEEKLLRRLAKNRGSVPHGNRTDRRKVQLAERKLKKKSKK